MNYAFSPKGPCMTLFITFCLFFKQKLKKYVVLVLYFGKQLVLSFHVIGCVRDLGLIQTRSIFSAWVEHTTWSRPFSPASARRAPLKQARIEERWKIRRAYTHMTFRKGDVEEESGWAHWLLEAYELEVYTVKKLGLLFQNFQAATQLV